MNNIANIYWNEELFHANYPDIEDKVRNGVFGWYIGQGFKPFPIDPSELSSSAFFNEMNQPKMFRRVFMEYHDCRIRCEAIRSLLEQSYYAVNALDDLGLSDQSIEVSCVSIGKRQRSVLADTPQKRLSQIYERMSL
jgi:hypothetical protein